MLLVPRSVGPFRWTRRTLRSTSYSFGPSARAERTPKSRLPSSRWTGRTQPGTFDMFQPSCESNGVKEQRQRPVASLIIKDDQKGLSTSLPIQHPPFIASRRRVCLAPTGMRSSDVGTHCTLRPPHCESAWLQWHTACFCPPFAMSRGLGAGTPGQ